MYNRFAQQTEEEQRQTAEATLTQGAVLPPLQEQNCDQMILTLITALLLKENYTPGEILTILSILEEGGGEAG